MKSIPHSRVSPPLAVAAALTLALTGCAGGGAGADAGSQAAPPELDLVDSAPAADGTVDEVRWLLAGEPAGFDTDRAGGSNEDTVVANVCERLFQQQPDLTVEP